MLSFSPLTWEDKEQYTTCYQRCPVHHAEYSFFGLWGWRDSVPLDLAFEDGLCWIRSHGPQPGICGPLGDWNAADWESVLSRHFARGDVIYDVPREAADSFPEELRARLSLEEAREQWEYVYRVQDLITLKGSQFAHKRNRVRAFVSGYEWDYFPMLPEDFPDVMEFQERWRDQRDRTMDAEEVVSLYDEDLAIRAALESWDDFPFLGGILRVEGEIVAYTIAEELDLQTLDIRFEKALGEYTGSYQAINQLFLKNQGASYIWVNREEDMGEPGLRKAKLSYNPARMLEKYRVTLLA
ncbi:MAG: phosphatidylglycerol lysyltransferase domain-containing protein [Fretibacterium sp.]|nr:phosphatidylglycerol lysyltransferase domain-containing protein [Fretibacterium sp.]